MRNPAIAGFLIYINLVHYLIVLSLVLMEVSPIIVDAVSGIGACIIVEVSDDSVVSVSPELPQAVNTPAITIIAKNFFIVLDFYTFKY
jgi:hypothetical protein